MDFVQNDKLTPEGEHLIAWMDSICQEAERTHQYNFSGYMGHYYVNAFKGGGKGFGLSKTQWLEQFESAADAAYDTMRFLESQAAEKAQQVETQNSIVEQLEALRKEITQLKRRNTLLENKVNATEPDAVEDEPPAEDEPEPDEAPAEEEETDEPEADTEEA